MDREARDKRIERWLTILFCAAIVVGLVLYIEHDIVHHRDQERSTYSSPGGSLSAPGATQDRGRLNYESPSEWLTDPNAGKYNPDDQWQDYKDYQRDQQLRQLQEQQQRDAYEDEWGWGNMWDNP